MTAVRIEEITGIKYFTFNEKEQFHSYDNKPSIQYNNGNCMYHYNGAIHREDGPAIVNVRDINDCRWLLHGVDFTEEIKEWAKENNLSLEDVGFELTTVQI